MSRCLTKRNADDYEEGIHIHHYNAVSQAAQLNGGYDSNARVAPTLRRSFIDDVPTQDALQFPT